MKTRTYAHARVATHLYIYFNHDILFVKKEIYFSFSLFSFPRRLVAAYSVGCVDIVVATGLAMVCGEEIHEFP